MSQITLSNYIARDYQLPLCKAMLVDNMKRAFVCWPRRSGKDLTAFNILLLKALKDVGTYYIIFPTFAAGRRILWDAITIDGNRLIDFVPEAIITSKNDMQMKIWLKNGSSISVLGSNDWDETITGTNPTGIIFSEYAQQDPNCWKMGASPIMNANPKSWCLFLSTPRGKNHFWDLMNIAKSNPDVWYTSYYTIEDTKHVAISKIESDIAEGTISKELAQQEYWCDFALGIEGSYYGEYINNMRLDGRIGNVPWDPAHPVHVSFDLGIRDCTALVFAQYINNALYIIESFEESNKGLDYFIKLIKDRPYQYGRYLAPCDIHVREYTSGRTRYDIAKQLGIQFTTIGIPGPNNSYSAFGLSDSIEVVRTVLPRTYIDATKNKRLVRALESYRKEFDYKYNAYKSKPVHDEYSHLADSFRYLCLGIKKFAPGMTKEDIAGYNAHMSPNNTTLPPALNKNFSFKR